MKKTQKEKGVERAYDSILTQIIEPLTGRKTTYLTELNGIGRKLFGVKFKGVFPSDHIPRLNDLTPYAILNLDTSLQPGSHWVSIAKHPKKDQTLLYDSFARKGSHIIPALQFSGNGRLINADRKDREQALSEENCGARALAWLVIVEKYGWDAARLI
jgi:hypothetical protein